MSSGMAAMTPMAPGKLMTPVVHVAASVVALMSGLAPVPAGLMNGGAGKAVVV